MSLVWLTFVVLKAGKDFDHLMVEDLMITFVNFLHQFQLISSMKATCSEMENLERCYEHLLLKGVSFFAYTTSISSNFDSTSFIAIS